MSSELMQKADEILTKSNIPDRNTLYQIEKFVIGKEVTAHAQLWQIARELESKKESVENTEKQLKDAEDQLEAFDLKIRREDLYIKKLLEIGDETVNSLGGIEKVDSVELELRQIEIQEHEINIRKLERDKQALVKSARKVNKKVECMKEEIQFYINAWERVEATLEGDIKPIDDVDAQKEMWGEKLLEEFNLRILLNRPLDTDIVKTIMSLEDDVPVKKHVAALLIKLQNQMIAKNERSKELVDSSSKKIEEKPSVNIKASAVGP
jgi:hypothetical protein